jgi:hypothetical protein
MAKKAINFKNSVTTYTALPIVGNTQGDVRTTTDTGFQYYWSVVGVAGALTDWKMLNDRVPSTINEQEKLNLELEMAFKAAAISRYKELTYVGKTLTAVDIYTSAAKTVKLFNKTFAYVGKTLTKTVLTRISDGTTLTKDLAYIGKNLISVTIS